MWVYTLIYAFVDNVLRFHQFKSHKSDNLYTLDLDCQDKTLSKAIHELTKVYYFFLSNAAPLCGTYFFILSP